MASLGKQFEKKFYDDWHRTFKKSFLIRVPDQQSGYRGTSQNICDFIGFTDRTLFLLECKTKKGNTFPFQNLTQYSKLVNYEDYENIKSGVILWFYEHDRVVYVSIKTIHKMIDDGKKSINILKSKDEGYDIIDIPSIKKRTFMDSDYSILIDKKVV